MDLIVFSKETLDNTEGEIKKGQSREKLATQDSQDEEKQSKSIT